MAYGFPWRGTGAGAGFAAAGFFLAFIFAGFFLLMTCLLLLGNAPSSLDGTKLSECQILIESGAQPPMLELTRRLSATLNHER